MPSLWTQRDSPPLARSRLKPDDFALGNFTVLMFVFPCLVSCSTEVVVINMVASGADNVVS